MDRITKQYLEQLLAHAETCTMLFADEPNYRVLPSDKPIVFVGDTHGDADASRYVLMKYMKTHRVVFLGDYVDRGQTDYGSLENLGILLLAKSRAPEDIIMLRGNHEFWPVYSTEGFLDEIVKATNATDIPVAAVCEHIAKLFHQLPYAVSTENGVLALHAGLPNISSPEELHTLPKGVTDYLHHPIICQIVWNDNVLETPLDFNPDGIIEGKRHFPMDYSFTYGNPFFKDKMEMLGMKALVRGHDRHAKGYSLNDRILTVFTSKTYDADGMIKGSYVALLDPGRDITTAKDLDLHFLEHT